MKTNDQLYFLEGGGEMGALTRAYPWEKTVLGPPEQWPGVLKATISIILNTGFPMVLFWGDDNIQFYNDAYRPSLGNNGKHPHALGMKGEESWPELWTVINGLITEVKATRMSRFFEDTLNPIYRNGRIEDVYWTFSYSAVVGESGKVDGVLVVCTEVTKAVLLRKELELSHKRSTQSENNLVNMIAQAPVAMSIFKGPNHVLEVANEKMYELMGHTPEEVLNKPVFEGIPSAQNQGFEDLLNKVYTTGETVVVYDEPVILPRNGKLATVYVQLVYEPFRNELGEITGVMNVAIDVTERVKTSTLLEQSEVELRAVIESAPFPIGIYVGREMRIRFLNKSIMDVWGKGDTGLIGKTYHEALPELESQAVYEQLDRVFTTGEPFHARNQRIDLVVNGLMTTSYFNYSFTPLYDQQGKIYGVMNTAADVTDLNIAKNRVEQSERNFRNMVNQAPVAMAIMLGPDHVVEAANEKMISLWGKPVKQVMNKPIFEGLPDAKGQGLEELLARVYAEGIPFHAYERPVTLHREGRDEVIYQNFVYEPYRDSDGKVLGVLAITIDVTPQVIARLKIEDVVRERTESLRKSNEELSRFAYVASHDLQEPVRKISVFAEMLEKSLGPISEKSASYLNKIDVAANRMLNLIRGILELSRLSDVSATFKQVNLNDVLEEVKSEFELLIEQKGCTVESDELPSIQAIPLQMNQLFGNLLSNALKFTKPGVPLHFIIKSKVVKDELRKKYPNLKPSQEYVMLTFSDNGIGFAEEYATRIFEVFQRLHTSSYSGTGIGLATAKKIADNHKGFIEASSKEGEGATFTIVLPVSQ